MEDKIVFKTLLISTISAAIGYLISTKTGIISGIIATFMMGWILFQFRSLEGTWENLANFQNPVLFGINTAFAAYIYASWNHMPTMKSLYFSTGFFLLGGALSLLIYKYWNMGP